MNPEARIKAYLEANKGSLRFATIDEIVRQVKLFVFYGASPISDEEIRTIVARWAMFNAVGVLLPPLGDPSTKAAPGAPKKAQDSELIDTVKKAITTIADGVTIRRGPGSVNIGVTGLTANLKQGDRSASVGISWGGTLKMEAGSGPIHFSSELSKDKWEMKLSIFQDDAVPDLSSLGKIFTEGERAVGKIAAATGSFTNITDAGKVGALIKPHVTAVQDAIDAAKGIGQADKQGGKSFGFKLGSPEPGPGEQGIPKGVQGTVVFTYWF